MREVRLLAMLLLALLGIQQAAAQALLGEFPIPTFSALPFGITAGPDGNVWFAESNQNKIGRITPAGVITEFPTLTAGSAPNNITLGPDGNLWATLEVPNAIARITPAGVVTEFPVLTGNALVNGITSGADGNLWFAEENANKIGRITTSGVVSEFATPTAGSDPIHIARGPDGNVWFTHGQGIGRITPAGVITIFSNGNSPRGITTGPDGNLWSPAGLNMLRITPAGVITPFPLSTGGFMITTGPDGNLWLTTNNNSIAKFSVNAIGPAATTTTVGGSPNPSTVGQSVTFTATVSGSSPTGTVQFKDGATNLGAPVALSGGVATLITSALTQGSHSITAVYSGDTGNAGSTSAIFTQTVNAVIQGVPTPAATIPTLSEWALALLAVVLSLFGALRLRRKS